MRGFSIRSLRFALAVCAALPALLATGAPVAARPNIVLIVADDLGYGDLSVNGNPDIRTSNLDALARQGIAFDRFFVSPVCAPTRAALLTGRYPLRTGVWGVTGGREYLRPQEVTLAETLRAAGYRTGIFGKWHNGEHHPLTPQGQDFDRFLGFHYGHINDYFDAVLEDGSGRAVPTTGYVTDVLTDAAIDFITRNQDRPFFLQLAHNVPHTPYQVPDAEFNQFRSKGMGAELASIYGMIAKLDANVGRLLRHLDTTGLARDTVVAFLSDNGAAAVPRYNAGMRGRKGSVDEGGGRVPLFVRWPARWPGARKVATIAAHVDLYPTLLEVAGVPVPNPADLDGRSLVPLIDRGAAGWPVRMLFTHMAGPRAVAEGPGAVRSQRHRWLHLASGDELYDMLTDPGQRTNIIASHPDLAQRFRAAYLSWFREVTRAGFARLAPQVGHAVEDPAVIEAPLATLTGGLVFSGDGAGNAHAWIKNWATPAGRVTWDINVVTAGRYRFSLGFACPARDAGSRLALTVGASRLEVTVPAAEAPYIPLANRAGGQHVAALRRWPELVVGELQLGVGSQRLQLQALSQAGATVMELKHVALDRLYTAESMK